MSKIQRTSSVEEIRFKQVSDERRKILLRKMPWFLFFFLSFAGFYYYLRWNYKFATHMEKSKTNDDPLN